MIEFREDDTVRITSGDYAGRVCTVVDVRFDGSIIVYLPRIPHQPEMYEGLLAVNEGMLEVVGETS